MKIKLIPSSSTTRRTPVATTLITALFALSSIAAQAAATPMLLDDYSDPTRNKNGVEQLLIDDKATGSKSQATQKCENGVLAVKGDRVPGRGVPAFISEVSLLSADGKPKDLTGRCLAPGGGRRAAAALVAQARVHFHDDHRHFVAHLRSLRALDLHRLGAEWPSPRRVMTPWVLSSIRHLWNGKQLRALKLRAAR